MLIESCSAMKERWMMEVARFWEKKGKMERWTMQEEDD